MQEVELPRMECLHVCRCNGAVRFALNKDSHARLRFAALQSDTGRALLQRCGRRLDDISSVVLVEEDRCSIKSEAVLRIARILEQPFPVVAALFFPMPGLLRDALYDQVCSPAIMCYIGTHAGDAWLPIPASCISCLKIGCIDDCRWQTTGTTFLGRVMCARS